MTYENICRRVQGKIIVSCQALSDEPLHSPFIMGRMAKAAVEGGACGIRANTFDDIMEIKNNTSVPIIGIVKKDYIGSDVYITPTMKEVDELINAGVDIIAVQATEDERPGGLTLKEFYKKIKLKYPKQLVMADCSTVKEAIYADKLGFDFIGTTLIGYTNQSKGIHVDENDFAIIKEILKSVNRPVIAEGNIDTPLKAKRVIELGCFSVVVGSIITRPQMITKRFVNEINGIKAIKDKKKNSDNIYLAIDIGGTSIKSALINEFLDISNYDEIPTESKSGGRGIEKKILRLVSDIKENFSNIKGVAISTAGMVDPLSGEILHAGPQIPEYKGINLKKSIEKKISIPCFVDNDVKCAGVAEMYAGEGKDFNSGLILTVGTGIGACYAYRNKMKEIQLWRGHSYSAFEVGYMHQNGATFQELSSTTSLVERVRERTGEELDGRTIMERAMSGKKIYHEALDEMIESLVVGVANLCYVINPEIVIFGGGIMEQKCFFGPRIETSLKKKLIPAVFKNTKIAFAKHGNRAGLMGAFIQLFQTIG